MLIPGSGGYRRHGGDCSCGRASVASSWWQWIPAKAGMRGADQVSRLLRPVYAVFEAVYQCLPGGFDDVLGDADGSPHALPVGRAYEDSGRGGGGAVLVQDADLVVGEVDFLQLGIVRPDGFS